jgi:division/cell wall cluster transcriptional repressor MraZ
MLRGSSTINMDIWGRVKIPSEFLRVFEEYGKEVFITSIDLRNILVYPLAEWMKIATRDSEKADDPLVRRSMLRINRHGLKTEIDEQGRILIPKELREVTNLKGKIEIEGREDHLELMPAHD